MASPFGNPRGEHGLFVGAPTNYAPAHGVGWTCRADAFTENSHSKERRAGEERSQTAGTGEDSDGWERRAGEETKGILAVGTVQV